MSPARDPRDALLAAMFQAWRDDVDGEPLPDLIGAVLRGEHAPTHELAGL